MSEKETIRTTFAQDTKMTPGIISIIAKIADKSITTYKQRKEASQKYFKAEPKLHTQPEKTR
jgi:hypothetical protein